MKRLLFSCFFVSLSSFSAMAVPLTITSGFNQDVVADGSGTATSSTSATMDGFNVFFDPSYASAHGLPSGGLSMGQTITGTSSGVQYNLASASPTGSTPNVLLLGSSDAAYPDGAVGSSTSGTLTFSSLSSVETLYVLGTSANNSSTLNYQLNFAGGVTATGTITYQDWGSHAAGVDVPNLGRANTTVPAADTTGLSLYGDAITVPVADLSLTLNSITFSYDTGGAPSSTAGIFAISAIQAPEPSTWAMLLCGLLSLVLLPRFTRQAGSV